jgi:hypothetical protein
MKTILRIIMILLVAALVTGAFFLAVNNNSSATVSNDSGQPPALTDSNGQTMTRPEGGDHDSGSLAGGLAGVLGTLLKITGITILVVMLQKGWSQLSILNRKFAKQ